MTVIGSSNSVIAKARALYANRLTSADYAALLSCKDTAQIADYLKSKTCYGEALQSFSASAPYIGQLQSILRNNLFAELGSICRFEKSIGKQFYKYFVYHNDCIQILLRLRTMNDAVEENYTALLPTGYSALSDLDLEALAACHNVEQVKDFLKGTPYRSIFEKNEHLLAKPDGILWLETEMHRFCGEKLAELIKKNSGGKNRKELLKTVGTCKDAEAIISLYRLKRFYSDEPSLYGKLFVPELTRLSAKELSAIIGAEGKEYSVAVHSTQYAPIFEGEDPETEARRMIHGVCKKRIRFSSDAAEVMWCFLTLREHEINDIINIFEGLRCNVPAEYIKKYINCNLL